MSRKIVLESITPDKVSAFKAIRLCALRESSTAFGSTYAEESQLADAQWLDRVSKFDGVRSIGYLAVDAEAVCGLVRATLDDQDSTIAWVESMWVAPNCRRTGVGRLLVGEILAWARGRGLRALKLAVTSGNEPAICFYQSLGFCSTGKTEPHPREAGLVECEMALPIRTN